VSMCRSSPQRGLFALVGTSAERTSVVDAASDSIAYSRRASSEVVRRLGRPISHARRSRRRGVAIGLPAEVLFRPPMLSTDFKLHHSKQIYAVRKKGPSMVTCHTPCGLHIVR
jgi:hypothetical protein